MPSASRREALGLLGQEVPSGFVVEESAGEGAEGYESGQLVVTLPGVIRTVTHCGFGPANPG